MAPTKPSKGKRKTAGTSKQSAKPSKPTPGGISKNKAKKQALAKPGGAQKTKPKDRNQKKKRVYTEKELDLPQLNGIVPAGIAKPKGQKKGKKFVDDPASMMAIMSVVNAEKEGHIESKIQKQRQLEEIREAKRVEAEKKSEEKKAKFEDKKDELRKKRRKSHGDVEEVENEVLADKPKKKKVSFG